MDRTEAAGRRSGARKAFLKRAQLVVGGGAALDCVVENLSPAGARVRLGAPVALPEAVSLRFPGGAPHAARRRWARGTAVGLEFEGEGPAGEAARRHLAEAVRGAARAADPAALLDLLRTAWFFGDEDLRRAAAELELVQARLTAALAPHLPPGT